ncbi:AAA-domain-containing protein [Cucurbitaria berberidis CBS 394.84]|uniref:AAA-domain-containing protein n=1 Tax=Cucurbitaria berberidis CBS 394.84 TaxID=1168544 RepID=A0A9P4GEH4_9PLEO|nr:AAA-domain-containing protein [Cucurbitaria berberidis CBS 394.84]KAF1843897.1 AAA-domain-containing protein [Cucurbitaria berberidis CBS 394.84]
MRANTTQKAYDEAFLACSTAVYFESQNNEQEALRSWKTALDHIYYHNARRNPTTYRPASETEKALLESLRQLELQCKERVDLLETLKRSREESKESLALPAQNAKAPTPPLHGVPVTSSYTEGSSAWLGGGSVPPIDYTDLSRPPPLPYRPAMAPRKSSGTGSARDNSLTQTRSASTLAPGTAEEKTSRTPSPEKKGRMLRTLRPGRDSRASSSKLPSSLRSRPEASKAATQAWSFKTTPTTGRPSLGVPTSSTASARSSIDRPAIERPCTQPQSPFYFQAGEVSASAAYTSPALGSGGDPEPTRSAVERPAPPITRKSVDSSRVPNNQGNSTALPSYRKEYPPTTLNPRSLAASAAARSYSDHGTEEKTRPSWDPATRRLVPTTTTNNNMQARNMPQREPHEPVTLEEDEDVIKSQPPPARKGRARGDSMRADLPPTPKTVVAEPEEEPEEETDEWKRRTEDIMKNLPRGVDKQAAQQILNEIVIQGDEVHWDDVAGLDIAKSALKETVVYPFLRPDLFMGLREPARGMLLFGPPGTGKTMLARAVATESKSTFFAISASSLTSKFLGESEKLVRALFQLAKMLAPSIIFVDEIDSLLSSRSGGEHEATRRIKTEFLIQWSDLQKAAAGRDLSKEEREKGDATRVLVLAATNLPWAIDEAARRRFVRRQYIPLPEDWVRKQQVNTLLSHQKHELSERDLDRLVQLTEGFSGSDITALAKDAAMGPLRSLGEKLLSMTMDQIRPIQYQDFIASLQTIRPSVSKQGLKEFEDWAREFGERGG